MFIAGVSALIPIYLLFPAINLLAERFGMTPLVWTVIALQLVIAIIKDMGFGEIQTRDRLHHMLTE